MWTKPDDKSSGNYERVYDKENDLTAILHQIKVDLREEYDQSLYSQWGISPKEMKWCDIKVSGHGADHIRLELKAEFLAGGYRIGIPSYELDKRNEEVIKLLNKFEKAVRDKYKEYTGKALRLSKVETASNREKVAFNDLYRFFAIRSGLVKLKDGIEYPEDQDDRLDKIVD